MPIIGRACAAWALFALCIMSACEPSQRIRSASDVDYGDSVFVAAAWSWKAPGSESYWRGLSLGVQEVNEDGGMVGRPLALVRVDDEASVTQGRLAAQRVVNEGRFIAVIGHLHSYVSVPAATVYDGAELIMINPASTAPELTQMGSNLVFRTVNSDAVSASHLAEHAGRMRYRRIAICYVRNAYGLGLANAFEVWAQRNRIDVVDRKSYEPAPDGSTTSYARVVEDWRDLRFDAILLAGAAPDAAQLIRAMRESGISQPIFGGDALDDEEMLSSSGPASDGLVVLTVFHPDNPSASIARFKSAFRERYGLIPDSWAARGYDAILVLAKAIRAAESIHSHDVASTLRTRSDWSVLTGPIGFDERGDPVGLRGVVVRADGGRFSFVGLTSDAVQ